MRSPTTRQLAAAFVAGVPTGAGLLLLALDRVADYKDDTAAARRRAARRARLRARLTGGRRG